MSVTKKTVERVRKGISKAEKVQKNRTLIYKALTDPNFRKQLKEQPARVLGVKELTARKTKEVNKILVTVGEIEARILGLADELLCANGGPCAIA